MRKKLLFNSSLVFLLFLFPVLSAADTIVITAAEMLPITDDVNYYRRNDFVYVLDGSPWTLLYAPVHLPAGARIDGIQIIYYDNSDENLEVTFERMPLWNLWRQKVCEHTSSGKPGTQRISIRRGSLNYRRVKEAVPYFIILDWSGDGDNTLLRFIAAKIWYTPGS